LPLDAIATVHGDQPLMPPAARGKQAKPGASAGTTLSPSRNARVRLAGKGKPPEPEPPSSSPADAAAHKEVLSKLRPVQAPNAPSAAVAAPAVEGRSSVEIAPSNGTASTAELNGEPTAADVVAQEAAITELRAQLKDTLDTLGHIEESISQTVNPAQDASGDDDTRIQPPAAPSQQPHACEPSGSIDAEQTPTIESSPLAAATAPSAVYPCTKPSPAAVKPPQPSAFSAIAAVESSSLAGLAPSAADFTSAPAAAAVSHTTGSDPNADAPSNANASPSADAPTASESVGAGTLLVTGTPPSAHPRSSQEPARESAMQKLSAGFALWLSPSDSGANTPDFNPPLPDEEAAAALEAAALERRARLAQETEKAPAKQYSVAEEPQPEYTAERPDESRTLPSIGIPAGTGKKSAYAPHGHSFPAMHSESPKRSVRWPTSESGSSRKGAYSPPNRLPTPPVSSVYAKQRPSEEADVADGRWPEQQWAVSPPSSSSTAKPSRSLPGYMTPTTKAIRERKPFSLPSGRSPMRSQRTQRLTLGADNTVNTDSHHLWLDVCEVRDPQLDVFSPGRSHSNSPPRQSVERNVDELERKEVLRSAKQRKAELDRKIHARKQRVQWRHRVVGNGGLNDNERALSRKRLHAQPKRSVSAPRPMYS
jgi:hypothetical protein